MQLRQGREARRAVRRRAVPHRDLSRARGRDNKQGANMNDRIVVAYERVSTEKQDLKRQAVQRERAAEDHPDAELVVIQDDGVSAYKVSVFDRPGGRQL